MDADPFYEKPKKELEAVRLTAPDATSLIGAVIAGKYEIISFLGEGGMSSVFKARDLAINRIIALKILLAMRSADERSIVRFQKEAMAAGRLNHPNIVQLYDVGTHTDGTPYLVMDYVAGDTLAHRLHKTGSLSPVEALKLFIQICDALQHAHANGVIHRDIKPSNLLITTAPDGSEMIKILDFGIAKLWDETMTSQQATRTGEVFGSPLYMSPEQAVGNKIDARSDIYSVGCSLFESLCGVPPHMGESTLHTIMKHQSDKAPSLREASLGGSFPSELETIVAKTLMKDPKDRFQTMSELGNALGELLRRIEQGEQLDTASGVSASTSSNSDKLMRSSLRLPTTLGAIVICILAITVSAMVFSGVGGRPKPPVTQAAQVVPVKPIAPLDMVLPPSEHEAENHMEDGELATLLKDNPNRDSLRCMSFRISTVGLATIGKFKSLRTLNLTNAQFNDLSPEFSDLAKLHLLSFSVTDVKTFSNTGLNVICKIKTLSTLHLGGCGHISDAGLKGIARLHDLQHLVAPETNITDEGIRSIAKAKELRDLSLGDDDKIFGKTLAELAKLPYLENLELPRTSINDDTLAAIGNYPVLAGLSVNNTKLTDRCVPAILKLKDHLKVLSMNGTGISDLAIKRFALLSQLQELDVQGCTKVSAGALTELNQALPSCVIYSDGHTKVKRKYL